MISKLTEIFTGDTILQDNVYNSIKETLTTVLGWINCSSPYVFWLGFVAKNAGYRENRLSNK
ncbi:hypothetical protein BpPP18_22440 [Weizmannia acidilactici]|nr:hypothetical protein BpPP18_22440 [Weizmannia acidilactici]